MDSQPYKARNSTKRTIYRIEQMATLGNQTWQRHSGNSFCERDERKI